MLLEKWHENHQINILWLRDRFVFKERCDKNFKKSAIFHVFENINPFKFFLVMLGRLQVTRYGSLYYEEIKKPSFTLIWLIHGDFVAWFCSTAGKCVKIIENVKKTTLFIFSLIQKTKTYKMYPMVLSNFSMFYFFDLVLQKNVLFFFLTSKIGQNAHNLV